MTINSVMHKQATINIGTIGHVAHGKSTLVRQITQIQTTKHKKELERNITIKLGYANAKIYSCEKCPRPQRYKSLNSDGPKFLTCQVCNSKMELIKHVSFVDCPGHDVLMATMLTGACVMDAAILLIAANEPCPQPQTLEHLFAIEVMGLNKLLIVQNKCDLLLKEEVVKHHEQIDDFVSGMAVSGCPIVPASCQLGVNIDAVLDFIVNCIPEPDSIAQSTNKASNLERSFSSLSLNPTTINQSEENLSSKKSFDNDPLSKDLKKVDSFNEDSLGKTLYNICTNLKNSLDDVIPENNLETNLLIDSLKEAPSMVIIRSFDINKPGTGFEELAGGIIGGTITKGILKLNDIIEIRPGQISLNENGFVAKPYITKITSLQAESNTLSYASKGGLIGLGTTLDPFLTRADKLVGQVIGLVGKLPEIYGSINIKYKLFKKIAAKDSKVHPIKINEQMLVNVGSTSTGCTVCDIKEHSLVLNLVRPACCDLNDRVALSRKIGNHWRLIGYGSVIGGEIIEPTYDHNDYSF